MNEYCYILDYSVGAIYEIELNKEESSSDSEDILDRRGLKTNDCAWMFTSKKLNIESIKVKNDE